MGINVVLEDEQGTSLEEVGDPHNLLHHLLPTYDEKDYQLLRSVDWYANTVFNQLQMDQLLEELERIRSRVRTAQDNAILDGLEKLAKRCQQEVHTYLKFYGD